MTLPTISKKQKIAGITITGFTAIWMTMMGVSAFFDAYKLNFQSPIVIRTPVWVTARTVTLISPVIEPSPTATPSATPTATPTPEVEKKNKVTSTFYIEHKELGEVRQKVLTHAHATFGGDFDKLTDDMDYIINRESHYRPDAVNPESGACGIFQAYPCSKLKAVCPNLEVDCQVKWGVNYIKQRYASVENAQQFKLANGWY